MSEENFNSKSNWKYPVNVIRLVGLVCLLVIILAAIFRDRFINPPMWQVSVIGRGEISYTPDTAKVNVGVQVDKVYAADVALKRLNDTVDKIIIAVSQLGIDKKDIQTQNYSLYSEYNYIENVSSLAGYSANQQLVVTINNFSEDPDMVSKVISAATKAGANQINNVIFESSEIEKLKQEARIKAIADAKSKANQLSTATDVKLGKIVGWWENFIQTPDNYYPYYDGKGGGDTGTANIPSGMYTLIVDMNLNYQIK